MKIIGFAGSLRKGSYNRSLLQAALNLAPEGMSIEVFELDEIPLYNKDVEVQGFPKAVEELRQKIAEVDGVLIVTPEYNHSIPGVLKNAIDWVSRSPKQPFSGKPIAIMGGSDGGFGTVRAQMQLRIVIAVLNGYLMPSPQLAVSYVDKKIDEQGNLVDDETKQKLTKFLRSFATWVEKL